MIGEELEAAIGDAPEHIAGLRKLAVAFAIGGRLDDSSTAAPEELLSQIEATRKELERAGQVKRRKGRLTVQPEHLPEAFDDVSRFVPLAEIASIEKGKTGIKQAVAGEFPLVVTAAARETCDNFDFDAAAAIIPLVSSTGHGNASINRLHYQEGKFALGTILAAVIPHDPRAISARFLFEYLSAFKDELLVSRMTGTANVTLTIGRIGEVPVPLLSAEAQAKVDELMALCDRLEEARKTREQARDKLSAASLARLTASDTTLEDFPSHAAFALEALPALTTRADQIKTLRQTILNLAVRGKLVEQDPADEPARELLARARAAKDQIRKERRIGRSEDPEFSSSTGEGHSPSHWAWVHLSEFSLVLGGKRIPKGMGFSPAQTEHIYVRVTDMKDGTISADQLKYISGDVQKHISKYTISKDDIYITIAGTIGSVGVVPEAFDGHNLTENAAKIVFRELDKRFLVLALNSEDVQSQFAEKTKQMAQPKLALKRILGARVPVPPLAEQHRIVAKVDALMALCDRLEEALTTADTTRTRLLESLLHEALEPTANALEAAE